MNNKAVLSFQMGTTKITKYGKWVAKNNKLYFNYMLIAEYVNDVCVCTTLNLVDCRHNHQTLNAISKIIKYLENNSK